MLRIFDEAPLHDPAKTLRHRRRQRRRLVAGDGGEDLDRAVTAKRSFTREHLEEEDAEGEEIRAHVDGLALRLLGRHVGRRAEDPTVVRERLVAFARGRRRDLTKLRETEV